MDNEQSLVQEVERLKNENERLKAALAATGEGQASHASPSFPGPTVDDSNEIAARMESLSMNERSPSSCVGRIVSIEGESTGTPPPFKGDIARNRDWNMNGNAAAASVGIAQSSISPHTPELSSNSAVSPSESQHAAHEVPSSFDGDSWREPILLDHEIRKSTAKFALITGKEFEIITKLFRSVEVNKSARNSFNDLVRWKRSSIVLLGSAPKRPFPYRCSPSALRNGESHTLLHHAAKKTDFPEVLTFLVNELDIPVNITDMCGRVPLHYAAFRGSLNLVQELLNLGGDPAAADVRGFTPLMYAKVGETRSSPEFLPVRMLLERLDPSPHSPDILDNSFFPRNSPLRAIASRIASPNSCDATPPQGTIAAGPRLLTPRHYSTPYTNVLRRVASPKSEEELSINKNLTENFQFAASDGNSISRNTSESPPTLAEEQNPTFYFVLLLVDSRLPLLCSPCERLSPRIHLRPIPVAQTRSTSMREMVKAVCENPMPPFRGTQSLLTEAGQHSYSVGAFVGPIRDSEVASAFSTAWKRKLWHCHSQCHCTAKCDEKTQNCYARLKESLSSMPSKRVAAQEAYLESLRCPQEEGVGFCEFSAVENGKQLLEKNQWVLDEQLHPDLLPPRSRLPCREASGATQNNDDALSSFLKKRNIWDIVGDIQRMFTITIPYLDNAEKRGGLAEILQKRVMRQGEDSSREEPEDLYRRLGSWTSQCSGNDNDNENESEQPQDTYSVLAEKINDACGIPGTQAAQPAESDTG